MRFAFTAPLLLALTVPFSTGQSMIPYHASFAADAASNSDGIVPGALFIVKGFFPARLAFAPTLPLPPSLEGHSVTLTPRSGSPTRAWMYYTHGSQLAALLPSSTPPGIYDLTVTTPNSTITANRPVRVLPRKFRSFTNSQEGWGLAVIQNFVSANRVDRNMFAAGALADGQTKAPAVPGQTVILWGTGLGAINQPDEIALGRPLDLRDGMNLQVSVGGLEAVVTYAGRSPQFPGVDQINFVVPPGAITGCNVALSVVIDGQPSNPVTIAIAPPGSPACEHSYFSTESLERFDQGVSMGPGQMDRHVAGEFTIQTGSTPINYQGQNTYANFHMISGSFRLWSAAEVGLPDFRSLAPGRCLSWRSNPDIHRLQLNATVDDSADAGVVTLSGPGRPPLPLNGDDDYYYRMMGVVLDDGRIFIGPEVYPIVPGAYTLRGAGGSDIGPFEAPLQIPALLQWTNRNATTELDRTRGVTFTWTGGSPADRVILQGGGPTYGIPADPSLEVTTFVCLAPPGATSFTVPPDVLRGLAATSQGMIEITAFSGAPATFRTPVPPTARSVATSFGYQITRRRELPFR